MGTTIFVYANPAHGEEEAFDRWYADHLQEVVDACGFKEGTRYMLTSFQSRAAQPYRSVAVYRSDETDAEALYARMQAAFRDMLIPDCIDLANTHVAIRTEVGHADGG